MKSQLLSLFVLTCLAGCATTPRSGSLSFWLHDLGSGVERGSRSIAGAVRSVAGQGRIDLPARWEWVTGIPQQAVRGELIEPWIPGDAVAALVPQLPPPELRLVAYSADQPLLFTAMDGQKIRNISQLHAAIGQRREQSVPARIWLSSPQTGAAAAADVDGNTVSKLCHAVAPQHPSIAVVDEGSPRLLIRQNGVGCELFARLERQTGLLHLVVGTKVYWGPPRLLPAEVNAGCGAAPLHCLTASQCLELLYGERAAVTASLPQAPASFWETSERADYLLATNFAALEQRVFQAGQRPGVLPPLPALATVQGVAYPGSAVLGDSRTLGYFLAQRSICHADEPERIQWVVFHGDGLSRQSSVDVSIDLGEGPIPVRFEFPDGAAD